MTEPEIPSSHEPPHALPSALLHELRTPLNHIIGFSEMLIEQGSEATDKNFLADLQTIHTAGKQLLSLLNENFHSIRLADTPATAFPREIRSSRPAAAMAEFAATDAFPADARRAFVLVVDDVEANRDILSRQLKRQGHEVATSENGRQALDRLRAETFDLVLLDIMMPEIDGYEVLQRLKADEALRHIPVIMISALSELDSVVRCIGMGAEDYLPKPFEPTLLKARITACLERKRAHDREQGIDRHIARAKHGDGRVASGARSRPRSRPHHPARDRQFSDAASCRLANRDHLSATHPGGRRCLRLAGDGPWLLPLLARRCPPDTACQRLSSPRSSRYSSTMPVRSQAQPTACSLA